MKRIFLFIATNLAVMFVFGIVASIIMPMLGINSNGLGGLLFICLIFGMGGSFISLLLSKWIAKRSVKAQVINDSTDPKAMDLVQRVKRLADAANITMPEVAVYHSADVNAFATGPSKKNSLVAVSTGLLNSMTTQEVDAVLAHEISHISNGDMVTLTLIQGVLNTFVMFFAHIVTNIIDNFFRNDEGGGGLGFFARFAIVSVLQTVFGIAASVIVNWFSRKREYAADQGAALLVGASAMIAALERLKGGNESELEGEMLAFGIKGKLSIFATHPSLDSRIEALKSR
ncbi:MAG: protease HtpX [Saccharospirillaceae bacterium]|nr:protease HtpX [Pseudomonadales bacterium]NRB80577.1 protease HtpX [Saccharospirillaceae bacterium]